MRGLLMLLLVLVTSNNSRADHALRPIELTKGIGRIETAALGDGDVKLLAFDRTTSKTTLIRVAGALAGIETAASVNVTGCELSQGDMGFAVTRVAGWVVGCQVVEGEDGLRPVAAQIGRAGVRYISLWRRGHEDNLFLASPCKDGSIWAGGFEAISSNEVANEPVMLRVKDDGRFKPFRLKAALGFSSLEYAIVDCTLMVGASFDSSDSPSAFWAALPGRTQVLVRGKGDHSPLDFASATISGNSLYMAGSEHSSDLVGSCKKAITIRRYSLPSLAMGGKKELPVHCDSEVFLAPTPEKGGVAAVVVSEQVNQVFLLDNNLTKMKVYPLPHLPELRGVLATRDALVLYGGDEEAFAAMLPWPTE